MELVALRGNHEFQAKRYIRPWPVYLSNAFISAACNGGQRVKEGAIWAPNKKSEACDWMLIAPEGNVVELTIQSLQFGHNQRHMIERTDSNLHLTRLGRLTVIIISLNIRAPVQLTFMRTKRIRSKRCKKIKLKAYTQNAKSR